jgi:hypothetical protein
MDFWRERTAVAFPRASSGPFEYIQFRNERGGLAVDGIARCDSGRLMFLLTYTQPPPLLTKKGKPRVHQPEPHKDETAKFYKAQCRHYGLPSKSNKNAAKEALLAFAKANGNRFIVPPSVAEVEAKLADEFKAKKSEYDATIADIDAREKKANLEASRKRKTNEGELLSTIPKKPKKPTPLVSILQSRPSAPPRMGLTIELEIPERAHQRCSIHGYCSRNLRWLGHIGQLTASALSISNRKSHLG